MQKGKNTIAVACTLEVINTLKEFSSVEDQNEGFHLIKRLLLNDSEFKKRFVEKYGQEVYDKTLVHYSKTNLQQREERKLKEQEQKIKEESKQKIEELRTQSYAKQIDVASTRVALTKEDKIKGLEEEIENINKTIENYRSLLQRFPDNIEYQTNLEKHVKLKEVVQKELEQISLSN